MKKSFKRSIAVLLSVIMVACSMPFTALAAAGEYKPDIQLQFGTFWNASAGSPLNQENQWDFDYSLSGIYGPVVDYKNGALVLDADKYAAWNDTFGMEEIEESYTLQQGDIFTLTVRLDNVDKISAFEAAISYSDAIAPFVDDDWDVDGTVPFLDESIYEGLNDSILGNLSFVDAENNVIVASAAANDCDYADVSETSEEGLTNPATGETGYNFAGKAVIATFIFQIVDAGPITFGIYNGDEDEDTTYGGAYYIADATEGTDPEDYTTYEPAAGAIGETDMTFMTKNEYVAPSGYTIKFVAANGDVISEEVYDEGATVTIPELPKMTNTATQHTTYAWDVTPSATATADATYTVVKTTADHDYTSEVVTPATCDKKGSTKYTCKVCEYDFTVQDIAATGKHNPAAAVEENKVNATCSKAGSYDSVVYCNDCHTELSRTPVTIDPTSHNYGEYKYNGDAEYTSSSVYKDGTATRTCGTCGAKDTKTIPNTGLLRARTANCDFGGEIIMQLATKTAQTNSFASVTCEFIREDGVSTIVEDGYEKTSSAGNLFFNYGVTPQGLNSPVKVIYHAVTKDGIDVWGPEYTYTMTTNYIISQLNKSSSSATWKNLLVELMYYGAEAQKFAGYKANEPMTDLLTAEQKALHTTDALTLTKHTDTNYKEIENAETTWRTATLVFGAGTEIKLRTRELVSTEGLVAEVVVSGFTYSYPIDEYPELFEADGVGGYYFYFKELKSNRLRTPIYITLKKNGVAITNTLQYSAESYAQGRKTTSSDYGITQQQMRYGRAAEAYFGV